MIDYIIVGAGLAGVGFAHTLEQQGKSFMMIDSNGRCSSKVAGGMYNPVVLKRFTAIYKAKEQLLLANAFYRELEQKLAINCWFPLPLLRKFVDVEEQNNWFVACDKVELSSFLSSEIIRDIIAGISSPYGFGLVHDTGFLDTKLLVESYRDYLFNKGLLVCEDFDYEQFSFDQHGVKYKNIEAKQIVFAQGMGLKDNPFFKELPLDGTKGELLLVRIADLKSEAIIKGNMFIIPIGNDIYKVGATYNWQDKDDDCTVVGKEELLRGLEDIISLDYQVIQHQAGVRPTVKDRRPLLGRSLVSDKIYVFNGLGTRGVLLGPYLASKLFDFIENKVDLDQEISIHRYKKFKIKN